MKVADILTLARASEAAKDQAMAMESSEPSTMIKTEPISAVDKRNLRTTGNKSNKNMSEEMKCFNCGNEYPHDKENGYPARNKECHKCKQVGHFAQCC